MAIPNEIQQTLDWLIQIDELTQARQLALTVGRYMPPNHPETCDFLAMILHKTKFYKESLEWAEKTVDLVPDQLEARYNLARCLNSAGEAQKAEQEIMKVIRARPDWLDPQLDCAMYICSQGRAEEGERILLDLKEKLPTSDPHYDVVRYNLGWHLLRKGLFKEGMKALAVGRKLRVYGAHAFSYPKPKLMKNLSLQGKTVLLVGEAGAGDEIINVRFAKTIQDRGGTALWSSGQKMDSLFSRVEGVSQIVPAKDLRTIHFDYWAPTMDTVTLLDLDLEDVRRGAYLSADPAHIEKWKSKIKPSKKLKVGLRWQGNPLYEQDLHRSVPFSLFRKYFELENAEFYSLQRDSGVEELSPSDPVIDLSQDLKTWEDTAAAISLLDVVVTSCTSIAHLAGALGKKTLVYIPMMSYYLWALPEEKSPWYADVTLFKQKHYHDWSDETNGIYAELKRISK